VWDGVLAVDAAQQRAADSYTELRDLAK